MKKASNISTPCPSSLQSDAVSRNHLPNVNAPTKSALPCARRTAGLNGRGDNETILAAANTGMEERSAQAATDTGVKDERKELSALVARLPTEHVPYVLRAIREIVTPRTCAPPCANGQRKHVGPGAGSGAIENGETLPELSDGLVWPRVKYSDWRLANKGGIVAFLRDDKVGWCHLLKAGAAELRHLRTLDPSAVFAIENYCRKLPGLRNENRSLPEDVRFLTQKEANDRQLNDRFPEIAKLRGDARARQYLLDRLRRDAAPPVATRGPR